jgi:hypothetical protein
VYSSHSITSLRKGLLVVTIGSGAAAFGAPVFRACGRSHAWSASAAVSTHSGATARLIHRCLDK